MKVLGIVFIVLGVLALLYGGISVVYPDKVAEIGPISLTVKKKESFPLSPVIGVIAIACGGGLLLVGRKT
ncbi:MAG: DUF3185 domain-containing protein [Pseudomonadota bacterium]|nr:DUF3185 domain-containing protein [Pseudomonadota bacterium]